MIKHYEMVFVEEKRQGFLMLKSLQTIAVTEKGMKMMNDLTITVIVLVFALLVFAFCCLYEQQANVLRKNSYIIARQHRDLKLLTRKNEQLQKEVEWLKAENKMLADNKPYYKIGSRGMLKYENEE